MKLQGTTTKRTSTRTGGKNKKFFGGRENRRKREKMGTCPGGPRNTETSTVPGEGGEGGTGATRGNRYITSNINPEKTENCMKEN